MNYGGAGGGNYGQHPGMGMGQPMHHQQIMNMQQQQQQQQQQRMMMQQQQQMIRPGAGYPPIHGGMPPQGMGMYPHGQAVRAKLEEAMKPWPQEWKNQVLSEKNTDKRNKLTQQFQHKWEMIQRQQMPHQQGMIPGPGIMFQQPGIHPSTMMPASMMGSNRMGPNMGPNQPAQMRMGSTIAPAHNVVSSFAGAPQPTMSAVTQPPSVPQVASLQNTSVPSPSTHVSAVISGQSPQVINPATPQNPASVQPSSIETNPPSQQDPEYSRILQELKKKHDALKKIHERCLLDQKALPKGFDKLIEVIENKRHVPKELLQKLGNNTDDLLERYSLLQPLLKEWKTKPEDRNDEENFITEIKPIIATPERKIQLDPFSAVSHLFLKVPEDAKVLTKTDDDSSTYPKKRHASDESDLLPKRSRPDNSVELEEQPIKREVECMFGRNGRKWELSEAAANELSNIPWDIDPECVPPSYKSPDVTVCLDAKILRVPPLRVQIPGSYPEKNPVVQFDRSFPLTVQVSAQLATLFERQLSLSTCRSITQIYESYKIACQELVRLRSLHHNQINDKHLRQQKLVA